MPSAERSRPIIATSNSDSSPRACFRSSPRPNPIWYRSHSAPGSDPFGALADQSYLDVLEKKPGAMAGSAPLEQWRQAGRWTENLDRMWARLQERHGLSSGTREMITLVRAGQGARGWESLQKAVDEALRLGSTDAGAVLYLMNMPDPEERRRYELA